MGRLDVRHSTELGAQQSTDSETKLSLESELLRRLKGEASTPDPTLEVPETPMAPKRH
jgi:hypothetical protein